MQAALIAQAMRGGQKVAKKCVEALAGEDGCSQDGAQCRHANRPRYNRYHAHDDVRYCLPSVASGAVKQAMRRARRHHKATRPNTGT
jgi:hypothetical protein